MEALEIQKQLLIAKLREIGHREAVMKFFSLLKELIESLGLTANDPRLALVVRQDKSISVNINFYTSIHLRYRNNEATLWLLVKNNALEKLGKIVGIEIKRSESNSGYTNLVFMPSNWQLIENTLIQQEWESCFHELTQTAESSIKREQHNQALYKAAIDDGFREELLNQSNISGQTNYWIFHTNPTYFDTISEIEEHGSLDFKVQNTFLKKIKVGDKVLLFISGSDSGIYAVCRVVGVPRMAAISLESMKYVRQTDKFEKEMWRVPLIVEYSLLEAPLFRKEIMENEELAQLRVFQNPQGITNAEISLEQFDSLMKLAKIPFQMKENEPFYQITEKIQRPDIPLNLVLYGPPGTGKTYEAQQLCSLHPHHFVTFHQSFSYEEFVEGIRPETRGGQVNYHVKKGIFYEACVAALQKAGYQDMKNCFDDLPENRAVKFQNAAPHLLVIDELNRANVSKVFGELVTLLEVSKRLGQPDELWLTLPYSQERLGVPANLYVLATMNSADRSIALLDTALRRRFQFWEFAPDPLKLAGKMVENTDLGQLLRVLNDRIERLYDRDHTLGHAYLLAVSTFDELCEVFRNQLIPLLQEYFYDDWQKIQLVLGDNERWNKPAAAKLIKVKMKYDGQQERALFGEELESYESVITYQLNPLLTQRSYEELDRDTFRWIYEKHP